MTKNMPIPECCNKKMSDWSFHRNSILEEKTPHFYCTKCSSHFYIDKRYTADEWFFYINGITYQEYQEQLLMEQGVHTHELVNHSNPEENDEEAR